MEDHPLTHVLMSFGFKAGHMDVHLDHIKSQLDYINNHKKKVKKKSTEWQS
jgi:hypothetical protein